MGGARGRQGQGPGGEAKEKGEPGPEVARIARHGRHGPGCEIINTPGRKGKYTLALRENNGKIKQENL